MSLTMLHFSINTIVLTVILLIKKKDNKEKGKKEGEAYERVCWQSIKKERSFLTWNLNFPLNF